MAGWIAELEVRVCYEREVTGLKQDDAGVDVELAGGGGSLRARYLVGCDGGRSLVRKAAEIAFPGWEATRSNLIAEVEMAEEPELGVRRDASGLHATLAQIEEGGAVWRAGDVFVCENPTVVRAAQRALGAACAPLICTGGWPSAAVTGLLAQLRAAGARLRSIAHGGGGVPPISGHMIVPAIRSGRSRVADAGRTAEAAGSAPFLRLFQLVVAARRASRSSRSHRPSKRTGTD